MLVKKFSLSSNDNHKQKFEKQIQIAFLKTLNNLD